jgi:hypothetical protein
MQHHQIAARARPRRREHAVACGQLFKLHDVSLSPKLEFDDITARAQLAGGLRYPRGAFGNN